MGENEQGGMLRVVVVIGLVALIAIVVVGAVIMLKGKMNASVGNATSAIDSGSNSGATAASSK